MIRCVDYSWGIVEFWLERGSSGQAVIPRHITITNQIEGNHGNMTHSVPTYSREGKPIGLVVAPNAERTPVLGQTRREFG
jgi:hypothetical protein